MSFLNKYSELVIATHNAGKLREISELVAPFKLKVSSSGEHKLEEPEETGDSFAANAEIKARATCEATGLPSLADDSGLCVDALNGAPGIYSARWAGEKKDFSLAVQRIEDTLLKNQVQEKDRTASFVCNLCLCLPDGHVYHFEGKVEGTLIFPARGNKGFGYDPIFVPHGESRTFAEMDGAEKHSISHRAIAFNKFVDFCSKV